MNHRLLGAFGIVGSLAAVVTARDAHAALVYIGGGDEHMGCYDGYLGDPAGWAWVRAHADGYYINTFPITTDPNDATQNSKLSGMAALFTNKNVFYETELDLPGAHGITDADDVAKLAILKANGFTVTLTTCNLGVTPSRIAALRTGNSSRPVLAMGGPWTVSGNISNDANWESWIQMSDGSATDSPLALWATDGDQCREGSYTDVQYTHSLKKTAMIMACPHGLDTAAGPGTVDGLDIDAGLVDMWYPEAVDYVRDQEDNDAIPDIWAISYYAAYLEQHPVTPEQVNGAPAKTVTGVGYYLIHHLRDPDRVVQWTVPAASGVVPNVGGATITAAGNFSVSMLLWNTSSWLDLIPVIHANVTDPDGAWSLTYSLDGADVTADLASPNGLTLYKANRLGPNSNKTIVVSRTLRTGANPMAPLDVKLSLSSHPSEPTVLSTQELRFGMITASGGEGDDEGGASGSNEDGGASGNVDASVGTVGTPGADGSAGGAGNGTTAHAAPSSSEPHGSCACELAATPRSGTWSAVTSLIALLPWIRRRRTSRARRQPST